MKNGATHRYYSPPADSPLPGEKNSADSGPSKNCLDAATFRGNPDHSRLRNASAIGAIRIRASAKPKLAVGGAAS